MVYHRRQRPKKNQHLRRAGEKRQAPLPETWTTHPPRKWIDRFPRNTRSRCLRRCAWLFFDRDELVSSGRCQRRQIYDSNRIALRMLERLGCEVLDRVWCATIRRCSSRHSRRPLRRGRGHPAVGVSVGEADFVKDLLNKRRVVFWKIAMKRAGRCYGRVAARTSSASG